MEGSEYDLGLMIGVDQKITLKRTCDLKFSLLVKDHVIPKSGKLP